MIKAIIFDFSRVLLFPKDSSYIGSLNEKHKELSKNPNYNILDHFELNHELLNFLKTLKDKYILCLFTTEIIQEAPEFTVDLNIFQKIFSGIKLGINKKDSQTYNVLASNLKLSPKEILFVDDSKENLDAAKKAGLNTIKYFNNNQIIQEIKNNLL